MILYDFICVRAFEAAQAPTVLALSPAFTSKSELQVSQFGESVREKPDATGALGPLGGYGL